MSELINRKIVLRRRPTGLVEPEDTEMISDSAPRPADGEALLRTTYVGLDAAVRTWLDDRPGYLPPVGLGEVIRAAGVGEVVESRCAVYQVGDIVTTLTGFQEYVIIRDDIFSPDRPTMHRETVFDGLESCVDALNGLFTGANIGKMLVKVGGIGEPSHPRVGD